MQQELIHLNTIGEDNKIVKCFLRILEENVGADYYSYLYLCFSSFESLMNDNASLRILINENNSHLTSYEEKVKEAKTKINELHTLIGKAKTNLFDLNFQPDLNKKTDELKNKMDEAFLSVLLANELLMPTDDLHEKIKDIKSRLKDAIADIKFAYDSLRSLKELKIFKSQTKLLCQNDFAKNLNLDYKTATKIFNQLWALALNEARGLNEIANFAKQLTMKYPTGAEEFDNADTQKAQTLISNYDQIYSNLSVITDAELI